MKYIHLVILVIGLAFLAYETNTGKFIGPKYVPGDCIVIDEELETWENKKEVSTYTVIRVGSKNYLLEYITPKEIRGEQVTFSITGMDNITSKCEDM